MNRIKKLLKNKKILISLIIIICLIVFLIFKSTSKNKKETVYTTANIEKGTLINSVSGSGQVISLDQIDIKPSVSGKLVYLNIKNGKKVNAGELLAQTDISEAQKAVWNAEINLKNAQLEVKDLASDANSDLDTAYNNVLNSLTSNFKDLSTLILNTKPLFEQSSYNSSEEDNNDADYYLRLVRFIQKNRNVGLDLSYWTKTVERQFLDIKGKYETVQSTAWTLNNQSSCSQIDSVLEQAYQVDKEFLDLIRQTLNLTQKYQYLISTENISTPISASTTTSQISKLSDLNTSLVSHVNDLNNIKATLETVKDTSKKVGVNTDSQNLTLQQKEYDLKIAKDTLNDCYVLAPFSGVITSFNTQLKINDQISTGTTLATIVTNQQIAEITLNEVDVAKVKVGQKANITFDAISDLTLTGSVIEIDEIGTVTQGVVTYNVHISFDQQDTRIKQGMSLSANIITDIKTDVYLISGSAVKEDNNGIYVEVLKDDKTTEKKYITTGLSNDTQTEIIDGLSENDNIIIKSSITNTNKQTTQSNTFGIPGMSGNVVRMR